MRIVGIDQGSNCGWATNAHGGLRWGTERFQLKRTESDGMRLLRFDRWLIQTWLNTVDLVVHEGIVQYVEGQPNLTGPEYVAVIRMFCTRNGINYVEVSPTALKSFAIPDTRPKETSVQQRERRAKKQKRPSMDRSKDAMIRAAMIRADREKPCDPILNACGLNEHEADALWLYWWGMHHFGGVKK